MNPPRTVVFDLGKVLLDFDYGIAATHLAADAPGSPEDLRQALDQSPLLMDYESGRMSTEEFFAAFRQATGYLGSAATFRAAFADIFNPIPEMVSALEALRSARVPICIFSNTNPVAVEHIREKYPFFAGLDAYVLSYEHGAMKPEPSIYEVVERITGCTRSDLAYLDDRPENVEAARQRGWRAILHQDPSESRRLLAENGWRL